MTAGVVGLLLGGWFGAAPSAQPYSAQITRALRAFGITGTPGTFVVPITGPASGGCTTPFLTVTGDTNSGIGHLGADNIAGCAGGATIFDWATARVQFGQPIHAANSAATAPAYSFASDTDTGFRWPSSGIVWFNANGLDSVRFANNSVWINHDSSELRMGASVDIILSRAAAGVAQFTRTALGTTSSTGLQLVNSTVATAGVPVQMSPADMLQGTAWDTAASQTVAFGAEVLPGSAATPTGIWKLGFSLNGAAKTYPLTVTNIGVVTTLNEINSGGSVRIPAANVFSWSGRSFFTSPANGLVNVSDLAGAFGAEINVGTAAPTVTTCGTGTITTGSRNTTGQITATGATACTVTFGAPAWTNPPFCSITPNGAPTTVPYINGDPTTTAFIIAGLTAGDNLKVTFHCFGRV